MTDSEREKFETHAKTGGWPLRRNGSRYGDTDTEWAWIGWQARAALDGGAVSQDDALEFIAKCCRLGLLDRGTTLVDELAAQISALRQPRPDPRERDLALIAFAFNYQYLGSDDKILAAFQRSHGEK